MSLAPADSLLIIGSHDVSDQQALRDAAVIWTQDMLSAFAGFQAHQLAMGH